MAQEKRIFLYDNAKIFLMILVVVGHFADILVKESDFCKSVYLFIYTFHMPLFIFISGQFHKNKNILQKVLSYTIIGFALKIILSITDAIMKSTAPKFSLLSDLGISWYMFAMAAFILFSYVLRNIDKRFLIVVFILLACFAGYDSSVKDYLYLSRIIVFYPFYLLGEISDKESVIKITESKWAKLSAVIILSVLAVLCFTQIEKLYFLRPLFTGRNPFSVKEQFNTFGCLYRAVFYAVAFISGFSFLSLMPNKKLPGLTSFGSRTLNIYFWQYVFIKLFVRIGLSSFLSESFAGVLVWLLLGVLVSFLLCFKIFEFPCKQIIKACREQKTEN
ncbi:MAG: acyltransferase [Clostridia bacterium]|nr:acyltransferase [Clostridia bacterium]